MARKKKHEEHVNTEAWAIPYGDLVTLLFALFTVMYALSSVNEGKLRVLSDSLIAAFRGTPRTMQPIDMGKPATGKVGNKTTNGISGISPTALMALPNRQQSPADHGAQTAGHGAAAAAQAGGGPAVLVQLQHEVQDALKSLIDAKLVTVTRRDLWLEVEINTDILFPSGSDAFSPQALPVLQKLAAVLKPFPNRIRVEGHTDDRPIHTAQFPSNWELSAARAATVVHEFTRDGVDPLRLEIVGFGEFHPIESNATAAGRNANRRVSILILEAVKSTDSMSQQQRDVMLNTDPAPTPTPAGAAATITGSPPAQAEPHSVPGATATATGAEVARSPP